MVAVDAVGAAAGLSREEPGQPLRRDVGGEFFERIQRQDGAGQIEKRNRLVRLVFRGPAQPIAIESDGPGQVSHTQGDQVDARFHCEASVRRKSGRVKSESQ